MPEPMMNPRLDVLLSRAADETATVEEWSELEALLAADPAARHRYVQMMDLHAELQERHAMASSPKAVQSRGRLAWLSWRPLTTAAAGLVIGLFGASVVFGFVSPRAVATVSRLSALVDGSFEQLSWPLPSGFPADYGAWSGHDLSVVEPASGEAADGDGSLRFVRCERGPCAVYQLIDLRSLSENPERGEARLVLSARFRDGRAATGETLPFFVRLYVFSGSPESFRETWPESRNEAISSGGNLLKSRGGAPESWQELSATTLLPSGADFALVHIGVYDPKAFPKKPGVFGEQFVDDVQLTLQTQPELPVRVADR